MRIGHNTEYGVERSEQFRLRLEGAMRREEDPRIKKAENKHTEFQEDVMNDKEAFTKKAVDTRRGGA